MYCIDVSNVRRGDVGADNEPPPGVCTASLPRFGDSVRNPRRRGDPISLALDILSCLVSSTPSLVTFMSPALRTHNSSNARVYYTSHDQCLFLSLFNSILFSLYLFEINKLAYEIGCEFFNIERLQCGVSGHVA